MKTVLEIKKQDSFNFDYFVASYFMIRKYRILPFEVANAFICSNAFLIVLANDLVATVEFRNIFRVALANIRGIELTPSAEQEKQILSPHGSPSGSRSTSDGSTEVSSTSEQESRGE